MLNERVLIPKEMKEFYVFRTAFIPALSWAQPATLQVWEIYRSVVKRPEREDDYFYTYIY
jgi:hypothetical protein